MVEQIRGCHRVVLHYMLSAFVGRATLLLLVHVTHGILLHAMYRASRDRFSDLVLLIPKTLGAFALIFYQAAVLWYHISRFRFFQRKCAEIFHSADLTM